MRILAALVLAVSTSAAAADPRADALALRDEVATLAPQLMALSGPPPADPVAAADQITADIIMPLFAATDDWNTKVTINGEAPYQPYADCLAAAEALAEQANALALALRTVNTRPPGPVDAGPFKTLLSACEAALGVETTFP